MDLALEDLSSRRLFLAFRYHCGMKCLRTPIKRRIMASSHVSRVILLIMTTSQRKECIKTKVLSVSL
ncbi:hypothetical protein Y1Q_0021079 [Alligator mississippiensis]|uniref:Uncharacterized protein n=1 Tax=Alligator mississippiensis TaxID=8496 RepID=A0A151NRF9_ALLMI|nr:hypothetical protein Y1Q_0021079 [Alligator mississippiensis]